MWCQSHLHSKQHCTTRPRSKHVQCNCSTLHCYDRLHFRPQQYTRYMRHSPLRCTRLRGLGHSSRPRPGNPRTRSSWRQGRSGCRLCCATQAVVSKLGHLHHTHDRLTSSIHFHRVGIRSRYCRSMPHRRRHSCLSRSSRRPEDSIARCRTCHRLGRRRCIGVSAGLVARAEPMSCRE